jgi:hypothetical protein
VKKYKMNKQAVKDLMFGGVAELMKNKQFYYFSSVGPQYCHWTNEGQEALQAYMSIMAYKFHEAETAELDRRAKEMVIGALKNDN